MAIFKRDKDKFKKKYTYKVTVCDPLGKSAREIKTFGANKTRNADNIVMLENDKEGFSEIFPLDNDYIPSKDIEEIEDELKILKNEKHQAGKNRLNKEQRIYELKKMQKALERKDGSFLKIDKDGTPHILYVRYRASFVPLKWDLDFGLIHTPVEPLIKNVLTVDREKREKYKQNGRAMITGGMFIMMIVLIIWTGILAYSTIKMFNSYDESNIAQLKNRMDDTALYCAETYGKAGDNFLAASNNAKSLTNNLMDYFAPQVQKNISNTEVR